MSNVFHTYRSSMPLWNTKEAGNFSAICLLKSSALVDHFKLTILITTTISLLRTNQKLQFHWTASHDKKYKSMASWSRFIDVADIIKFKVHIVSWEKETKVINYSCSIKINCQDLLAVGSQEAFPCPPVRKHSLHSRSFLMYVFPFSTPSEIVFLIFWHFPPKCPMCSTHIVHRCHF